MTSNVLAESARRLPTGAIDLARHAAVPVAIDARFLNLLRVNFFLDPPTTLPYETETALLLSPLFREIGEGLYEIDPASRTTLLGELVERFGRERLGRVAGLLEQYTDHTSAWHTQPELENAQRLTALNLLDPVRADEWLQREKAASAGVGTTLSHSWFVAMETRLRQQRTALRPVPSTAPDVTVAIGDRGAAERDAPRPQQSATLSVEIALIGIDDSLCRVEGWFRPDDRAMPEPVGSSEILLTDLSITISGLVEQTAERLADASALIVEIFLPVSLLDLPVDMAIPPDGLGIPLGARFPLILRSTERARSPAGSREWQQRWNALQHGYPNVRYMSDLSDDERVPIQLLEDPVTTVVLSSSPTTSRGRAELTAALKSGVPAILWDRRSTSDAGDARLLRQLATDASAGLPLLIQQLRRDAVVASEINHPGRHIALLWDDPTALPPEAASPSPVPRSTGDGPHIAIITALPVESRAVRAVLNDARAISVRDDPNLYLVGVLPSSEHHGAHEVVLATQPFDGTHSHAAMTTALLRTFPNLRALISCGISAGVRTPEAERAVRLGDVVVATGLVTYDGVRPLRRLIPSATFQRADQGLQMLGSTGRQSWLDLVRSLAGSRNFAPPGNRADEPAIHRAPVASANSWIRDSAQIEDLARDHGVLAIDREGAGLAATLPGMPWLVVRGVSDYADQPGKDSGWHSYAALTAATYVRALLAECPPGAVFSRPSDATEHRNPPTLNLDDTAATQAGEYLTGAEVETSTGEGFPLTPDEADELPDDDGEPEVNDDEATQTGVDTESRQTASTAAQVVRVARSQIGYQEGRGSDNKYGRSYGMNNVAWSQQFVWWVFHEAGAGGEMPKTAITRVAFPWYRLHRRLVSVIDAKPGDVVWFDYGSSVKPVSHVGIVEKNLGQGRLQTIEGDSNAAGSRTGGSVQRKVRSSRIVAVGRPRYDAPDGPAAVGVSDRPYPGHPIGLGIREPGNVRWIQARLNFAAGNKHLVLDGRPLAVDGDFGPLTEKVLKDFQRRRGLNGLGRADLKTWPLLKAIR